MSYITYIKKGQNKLIDLSPWAEFRYNRVRSKLTSLNKQYTEEGEWIMNTDMGREFFAGKITYFKWKEAEAEKGQCSNPPLFKMLSQIIFPE